MQRIKWLAIFILIVSTFAYAQVDMEHVVGVWLFDEGKGDEAADSSDYGHDGQITNAEWTDGKFGNALEFDGDGKVQVESTPELSLGEQLTMMAYFNTQALSDWHQIIAKNNEYLLRIDTPGEGSAMSAFVNLDGGWEPRASANVPEEDTWIHFTAVYDSDEGLLLLYVDGLPAGQSARAGNPNPNNEPVTFGTWNDGSRFIGMIDEVAIFDVALEEEDILSIATDGIETYLGGGLSVQSSGKLTTTWGNLKKR